MKKRRDCFFGLHFDFHANEHTEGIGSEFDGSVLERILREVKPDFVQCDTKGHPGYSSYPTKVGVPAPNIAKDTLRAWRNITEKYQVALYAHDSGILEERAAKDHPEWTAHGWTANVGRCRSTGRRTLKTRIVRLRAKNRRRKTK